MASQFFGRWTSTGAGMDWPPAASTVAAAGPAGTGAAAWPESSGEVSRTNVTVGGASVRGGGSSSSSSNSTAWFSAAAGPSDVLSGAVVDPLDTFLSMIEDAGTASTFGEMDFAVPPPQLQQDRSSKPTPTFSAAATPAAPSSSHSGSSLSALSSLLHIPGTKRPDTQLQTQQQAQQLPAGAVAVLGDVDSSNGGGGGDELFPDSVVDANLNVATPAAKSLKKRSTLLWGDDSGPPPAVPASAPSSNTAFIHNIMGKTPSTPSQSRSSSSTSALATPSSPSTAHAQGFASALLAVNRQQLQQGGGSPSLNGSPRLPALQKLPGVNNKVRVATPATPAPRPIQHSGAPVFIDLTGGANSPLPSRSPSLSPSPTTMPFSPSTLKRPASMVSGSKMPTIKRVKDEVSPTPKPPLHTSVSLPLPLAPPSVRRDGPPAPRDILDLTDEDAMQAAAASSAAGPIDVDEIVEEFEDTTATTSDDEILICELKTRITGMQHYRGQAKVGAKVLFVRDLNDTYDEWLILVKNTAGVTIGSLVRETGSVLAQHIDKKIIRIEGQLSGDVTNAFAIPVLIKVYSAPMFERSLIEFLSKFAPESGYSMHWIRYLNEVTNAPKPANDAAHKDLLAKAIMQQDAAKTLEALFDQNQEQQSKLPMAEQPAKLATTLLPYQRQGLYWLQYRESLTEPEEGEGKRTLFWSVVEDEATKNTIYYNHALKEWASQKPILALGGILADDMGLGKTIQTISLVVDDIFKLRQKQGSRHNASSNRGAGAMSYKSRLKTAAVDEEEAPLRPQSSQGNNSSSTSGGGSTSFGDKPTHLTLIVCPLMVVGNWVQQFQKHVEKDYLSVYVFHGHERTNDVHEFLRHDVIITTYQLLAGEYMDPGKNKARGPLQSIFWRRVVLDEAHTIKSRRTKQSLAASQLRAERRWCISGTPIQNELDDLYSLIKFLHLKPFDDHNTWTRLVTRPMQGQDEKGVKLLQDLIKEICLRRVKTMQINGAPVLPERNVYLHKIKFRQDELDLYVAMENESRRLMTEYIQQNQLSENYAHVLVILTRLRQLCDHKQLSNTDISKPMGGSGSDGINESKRQELLAFLNDNEVEDCGMCQKELRDPVITPCAHLFCRSCIDRMFSVSELCPVCRVKLGRNDLISNGGAVDDDGFTVTADTKKLTKKQWTSANADKIEASAKTDALIEYLVATRQKDPTIKSVIFSQWTSMLDVIEVFLNRAKFKFCRLDGQMQRKTRDDNINKFESDGSVSVMLISLKCGSLGINLTSASQVFLVDPWWNPSTEDQAIDRVHRIGQKRVVNVIRLVIEGTVEERVITLQEKKRQLMDQAFGKGRSEVTKEQRIADLKELFAMR